MSILGVLNILALSIGYSVLGAFAVLAAMALGAAVNDYVRVRNASWDRWLYDETQRWNNRLKRREVSRKPPDDGA